MEMQGRTQEGLDWMTIREPYWADDDNFFKVHNWWHHAVYLLDLGRGHDALALYDSRRIEVRLLRGALSPVYAIYALGETS